MSASGQTIMSAQQPRAPAARDDRRPSMARLTKVELRKMFDTRSGFWLPICVGAGRDRDRADHRPLGARVEPHVHALVRQRL